ncbi:MAG: hypothetical protein LPK02_14705 [Rhodobacterales bacterium]|nr:hypothetical protein [Rhodobacterales bacterium]
MVDEYISVPLIGVHMSRVFCLFFADSNGTIHAPISIIVPSSDGRHVAMAADGCGRIRFDRDFLAAVYHDKSLGYSFIAPISLKQGLDLTGKEIILAAYIQRSEHSESLVLVLDDARHLTVSFEDDEMFFQLQSD